MKKPYLTPIFVVFFTLLAHLMPKKHYLCASIIKERKMSLERLNFAIIAAGEGSRLAEEGVSQPKPLVQLHGEPMLGRLFSLFVSLQANSISVIVNQQMTEVQQFVLAWKESHPEVDLRICIQSTPSSMHSMAVLSEVIPAGRFILTTVDTVFRDDEFAAYVKAFQQAEQCDGLFAVTRFVDDEKPLWISTSNDGKVLPRIIEFSDTQGTFVSGGIYGLDSRTAFPVLHDCLASGQSRMRNYQRALLSAGLDIRAYEFQKIMDIDHKSDIDKAEEWVKRI